ncbi:hypothetical protein GQ53DRAFT_820275 [Thozetella sp. PMI_491]|nr:hypothetical protein GQ53DRAFT_820275 [Thozetella sp. PMI_491]
MYATTLLIVWLSSFAATGLAGTAASDPIQVAQRQHGQHDVSAYDGDVPIYGPLVPRGSLNGSSLINRAEDPGFPGEDTYGVLVDVKGCFFCPEAEVLVKTGRDLLADLTTAKMKTYMRITSNRDLNNKCVFYSQAVEVGGPKWLSDKASTWACSHNKISIWHLWPNRIMSDLDSRYQNFYGIYDDHNWLHSIVDMPLIPADRNVPTQIQYFENMSEAMAQSCLGEVTIVSQTPKDMKRYMDTENIWKNKERPALINLLDQGKIDRFLVVDYNSPSDIWEFDIRNNQAGEKVKESDLKSRQLAEAEEDTEGFKLLHRASCSSTGLDDMPPDGDPFSDPYSNFRH